MLVLVRHGEAVDNVRGVLLGRADSPLTSQGRDRVGAVAGVLGRVARVVSSPLGRARDSAEALGLGLPVELDDRWIEVDYGEFEGRTVSEVPSDEWNRWRTDPEVPWPGGESLLDVAARVRIACEELFSVEGEGARAEGDVVVVSHVSPIKAAVAWALGTGVEVVWRLYLANASVTRIAWGAGVPVLRSYNETFPLDEAAGARELAGRA